jgi:t-SNARE complex subunit (syntaxin)
MAIHHDSDLLARLQRLEDTLDRTVDLLARVADAVDRANAQQGTLDSSLADLRTEVQRGFADLRHAVRHVGARVGEADRHRAR